VDSALIVSNQDISTAFFAEMLKSASIDQIVASSSCSEARRLLLERYYDIVIINAPLHDEPGESLSREIASKSESQVILVVQNEFFYEASVVCESDGVLTVSKPINKTVFWSTLMLAKSAQRKIRRIQTENLKLKQKIEDIKIVDRAKLILISYTEMDEKEAHRYIEKRAMDLRSTKRRIAEGIIKTYEG
jgi:response regulator NasT